jgi:hypothetical protein
MRIGYAQVNCRLIVIIQRKPYKTGALLIVIETKLFEFSENTV